MTGQTLKEKLIEHLKLVIFDRHFYAGVLLSFLLFININKAGLEILALIFLLMGLIFPQRGLK